MCDVTLDIRQKKNGRNEQYVLVKFDIEKDKRSHLSRVPLNKTDRNLGTNSVRDSIKSLKSGHLYESGTNFRMVYRVCSVI